MQHTTIVIIVCYCDVLEQESIYTASRQTVQSDTQQHYIALSIPIFTVGFVLLCYYPSGKG
jgi:hypothetical protein